MAIVASGDGIPAINFNKSSSKIHNRRCTEAKKAALLNKLSIFDWGEVYNSTDVNQAFDIFYDNCTVLLNECFPVSTVTMTDKDPPFVTPGIKSLLKEKNKLLHKGKVQKAEAITNTISKLIETSNSHLLENISGGDAKMFWGKVNQVLGKQPKRDQCCIDVDVEILNDHFAAISHDHEYLKPEKKLSCMQFQSAETISEKEIFDALDRLKPTAAGPDNLPHWFLKTSSPAISKPLSHLINLSLSSGIVPDQWKMAIITPVPQVIHPKNAANFRPISVTSILS